MQECGIIYSEASIKEALQLWGDDAPDPDSDRRADLESALKTLNDEDAQALRLWSWGFPSREIAERLGKKPTTGWRFVARALAKLQSAMNGTAKGDAC